MIQSLFQVKIEVRLKKVSQTRASSIADLFFLRGNPKP